MPMLPFSSSSIAFSGRVKALQVATASCSQTVSGVSDLSCSVDSPSGRTTKTPFSAVCTPPSSGENSGRLSEDASYCGVLSWAGSVSFSPQAAKVAINSAARKRTENLFIFSTSFPFDFMPERRFPGTRREIPRNPAAACSRRRSPPDNAPLPSRRRR